jgi:hypothetical protein
MSASYLSVLQNDPLFVSEQEKTQIRIDDIFIDSRQKAMEVLEMAALPAAQMAKDAIVDGFIGGQDNRQEISVKLRMDSAWDVLNRTGNKATEKRIVAHVSLADMIVAAYKDKHGSNGSKDVKARPTEKDESTNMSILLLPEFATG